MAESTKNNYCNLNHKLNHIGTIILETERFVLRKFTIDDYE